MRGGAALPSHNHQTDMLSIVNTIYMISIYNFPQPHRLTIYLPLQPDFIFPIFCQPLSPAYVRGSQLDGGWGVRKGTVPFIWQESISLPLPKGWLKSDPLLAHSDEYQHPLNH